MEPGAASRVLERLAGAAGEARDALARAGAPRWELYAKASSWEETLQRTGSATTTVRCQETGLAVRTRRHERTGFAAASGAGPRAWRAAVEAALSVEQPDAIDPLPPPEKLGTTPLQTAPPGAPSPGWGESVLTRLESEVGEASDGRLRLLRASVRLGEAGWILHTAEGFTATHLGASCLLLAEVGGTAAGRPAWRELVPIPSASSLDPAVVARRLVDPLLLLDTPSAARSGVEDVLLDRAVAAHLLGGLVSLLVASEPNQNMPFQGQLLGSELLTLVDDRLGLEGPLTAPCDGEGLPSREIVLVDRGVLRGRLASYRDAVRAGIDPPGGAMRSSYREPPQTGVANLVLRPEPAVSPRDLLAAAGRCLYLLRLAGPPEVEPHHDRYRLSGIGVTLEDGAVRAWHPLVEVRGRVSRLLQRLEAAGSDRAWFQTAAGVVGTPSLLVRSQLVG